MNNTTTHTNLLLALSRSETLIATLRALAATPAASAWDFPNNDLSPTLLQFFPADRNKNHTCRSEALVFARALGGQWQSRPDGSWQCLCVALEGLLGTCVVLHYVEPVECEVPLCLDLVQPEVSEVA